MHGEYCKLYWLVVSRMWTAHKSALAGILQEVKRHPEESFWYTECCFGANVGHLTILCCLLARDAGLAHRIAFALPLVPATDFRRLAREDNTEPSASINAYKDGYLLSKSKIMLDSDWSLIRKPIPKQQKPPWLARAAF